MYLVDSHGFLVLHPPIEFGSGAVLDDRRPGTLVSHITVIESVVGNCR